VVTDERGLAREADNDNRAGELDFTPLTDPFDGDMETWLEWLMDCVAIESSIRRGRAAQRLEGGGGGPDAERVSEGAASGAGPGSGSEAPGEPGVGGATGAEGAVRDSTRPTGK
jgi:hypothetical protein